MLCRYDAYMFPDKNSRIDVIIFVHAFGATFASRLASAVANQAKSHNIAVLPVITCYDLVNRSALCL